jgi:hypothetical protein
MLIHQIREPTRVLSFVPYRQALFARSCGVKMLLLPSVESVIAFARSIGDSSDRWKTAKVKFAFLAPMIPSGEKAMCCARVWSVTFGTGTYKIGQ